MSRSFEQRETAPIRWTPRGGHGNAESPRWADPLPTPADLAAYNAGVRAARAAYAADGLAVEENPLCVACRLVPPTAGKSECARCRWRRYVKKETP